MSSIAEAIACVSLYGTLNYLLYGLSLPIFTVIAIEGLAIVGGVVVAIIGRKRIDVVDLYGGLTTSVDSMLFIIIAGLLGAGIFVYLADFGIVTVLVSVLGVAVLSWYAGIISIHGAAMAVVIVLIGALPGLVAFAIAYLSTNDPALAMAIAVLIGTITTGLLCRWFCSKEIWALPILRKRAGHMAWGGAGAWAIFGAWTLTFAQLSPDGLHSRQPLLIAVVLSQATILMLSDMLPSNFRQTTPSENLVLFMLIGSICGSGLGWLIQTT